MLIYVYEYSISVKLSNKTNGFMRFIIYFRLKKLNRGPKSPSVRSSSGILIPCSDNTPCLGTSPTAHSVMVHSSSDDQIRPPIITLRRKPRMSLQSVPTTYDSDTAHMEMTERKTVAASNSDDETIVGLLNQASTSEYQLGMICKQTS